MNNKFTLEHLKFLYSQGQFSQIIKNARAFRKTNPKNAAVFTILGVTFASQNMLEQAIDCFNKVTVINPKSAEAHNNLAKALKDFGEHAKALKSFERAIELNPEYIIAHLGLGSVLINLYRIEDSIKSFKKVLELQPDNLKCQAYLAQAYMNLGRLDEARATVRKILEIEPAFAEAHQNLSIMHRYKDENDQHIKDMQAQLGHRNLSSEQRVFLNFGLGKAFADLKKYDHAFNYWKEANAIQKTSSGYKYEFDQGIFDRIDQVKKFIPPIKSKISDDLKPVFILGMPRSGTSLVEQILSGHSAVHAAGEMDYLGHAIKKYCWDTPNISTAMIESARKYYLTQINQMGISKPIFTDKMPLNFRWICFIRSLFPNAKIIHLKRHPMAVCFSNFRNYFPALGMSYTYDLEDIGRFYLQYDSLMSYYCEEYKDDIITVDYVDLTQSPREQIEKLLADLGLEWEESCLKIEDNNRAVKTVSNIQIRDKIYTKSSEEWKNYETDLMPLRDMLKPVLERQGWD